MILPFHVLNKIDEYKVMDDLILDTRKEFVVSKKLHPDIKHDVHSSVAHSHCTKECNLLC